MKIVIGLGNPGSKYTRSRHNAGFWVVDRLARRHGLRFGERAYKSLVARGSIGAERVTLLKPQTYMNLSGEAAGRARRALRVEPPDVLVVYDEADLALGRLRVREGGGAGGHNGVDSIITALGGKSFPRVRVGIGRPGTGKLPTDYLLDGLDPDELKELEAMVELAADAVETWLSDGIRTAMNRFNPARS